MKLGEKIAKYRQLAGLTQKELGVKLGFSEASATSRIQKYEYNVTVPQAKLRQEIANILDIDLSAISDLDVGTEEDIIRSLFLLEETIGLQIERDKERTVLTIENSNIEGTKLNSYLYAWNVQNSIKVNPLDAQYIKWKSQFPKSIQNYWDNTKSDINAIYLPHVNNINKSTISIRFASEFLQQIRNLLESQISIIPTEKFYSVGKCSLVLTINTDDILKNINETKSRSFSEYLYKIRVLENHGLEVIESFSTNESGTYISYEFKLSPLAGLRKSITELNDYLNNIESKKDYEIKLFEDNYNETLAIFGNIDLYDEITRYNQDI